MFDASAVAVIQLIRLCFKAEVSRHGNAKRRQKIGKDIRGVIRKDHKSETKV